MRNAFTTELSVIIEKEESKKIKKTYLLTGDLGFAVFDEIKKKYPERVINSGISEQNMVGTASGMAMLGKDVFIYSIIPFLLYRTFEQVRNDICYPNLPVKLIGVGASLSYADAGATHHPLEDLKVADSLINLTVLSPSDPEEVRVLMKQIHTINGPVYMRITRNGEPIIHNKHSEIKLGKALKLIEGRDVLIISTGVVTKIALEAADIISKEKRKSVEVLEIHTFKPFDYDTVRKEALGKNLVVSVEDNTGALSEKVASAILGLEKPKLISFKLPNEFTHISGTRDYLFDTYGISTKEIVSAIRKEIE